VTFDIDFLGMVKENYNIVSLQSSIKIVNSNSMSKICFATQHVFKK